MSRWFKYFLGISLFLIAVLSVNLVFENKSSNPSPKKLEKEKLPAEIFKLPDVGEIHPLPQKKDENTENPNIKARQYVLLDVDSSYPILSKEELKPVPIASLTKLMTALVVLRDKNYDPEKIVEISKNAAQTPGSITILEEGEKLKVKDLLKALLINSTNSAAVALAEATSGSEEAFVAKMNALAQEFKMKNTQFKDSAGLNDDGRSCALDLARLGAEVFKNPMIRATARLPEATITSADGKISHELKNSNRLVTQDLFFPGIIGGKTGFTPKAGHSLLAVAQREEHTLVAVVINTYSNTKSASATQARKLLESGFKDFSWN